MSLHVFIFSQEFNKTSNWNCQFFLFSKTKMSNEIDSLCNLFDTEMMEIDLFNWKMKKWRSCFWFLSNESELEFQYQASFETEPERKSLKKRRRDQTRSVIESFLEFLFLQNINLNRNKQFYSNAFLSINYFSFQKNEIHSFSPSKKGAFYQIWKITF